MGQEVAPPRGLIVRTVDGRTEIIAPRPTWHRAVAFALAIVLVLIGRRFGFINAVVVGIALPFVGVLAFERRLRKPTHISLTARALTLSSGRDVALADLRHVDVEPSYVPGTTTASFEVRATLHVTDETVGHYDTAEQAAFVRGHILRAAAQV